MFKVANRTKSAIVLVSVALLAVSCSAGGQQGATVDTGETLMGYEAMTQEYVTSQADYPLPEGEKYPDVPPGGMPEGYTFQKGYGVGQAIYIWNCSWGQAYIDDKNADDPQALNALSVYESVKETDYYNDYWDKESVQIPFEASIEKAVLGDPSDIQREVSTNCPGGDVRQ